MLYKPLTAETKYKLATFNTKGFSLNYYPGVIRLHGFSQSMEALMRYIRINGIIRNTTVDDLVDFTNLLNKEAKSHLSVLSRVVAQMYTDATGTITQTMYYMGRRYSFNCLYKNYGY